MEAETLAVVGEIDFSFWSLFARATLTVKLVIIILIACSFWAWSIIVQRTLVYKRAKWEAKRFDRAFWSGQPLDELLIRSVPNPKGALNGFLQQGWWNGITVIGQTGV